MGLAYLALKTKRHDNRGRSDHNEFYVETNPPHHSGKAKGIIE